MSHVSRIQTAAPAGVTTVLLCEERASGERPVPVEKLMRAAAFEVVPETLEASLTMASQVLLLLGVAPPRVMDHIRQQRSGRYRLMREAYGGEELIRHPEARMNRSRRVSIPAGSRAVGIRLGDLDLRDVTVAALLRSGKRAPSPSVDTYTEAGDVLVLHGPEEELSQAEQALLRLCRKENR